MAGLLFDGTHGVRKALGTARWFGASPSSGPVYWRVMAVRERCWVAHATDSTNDAPTPKGQQDVTADTPEGTNGWEDETDGLMAVRIQCGEDKRGEGEVSDGVFGRVAGPVGRRRSC